MCRSIKPLFNFEPPVTEEEVYAASLQFVRKISGFTKPSKANEMAFHAAVDAIAAASRHLLSSLETNALPKDRADVAAKARARSGARVQRHSSAEAPSSRPSGGPLAVPYAQGATTPRPQRLPPS